MLTKSYRCYNCKHFDYETPFSLPDSLPKCNAFPNGIPSAILSNSILHYLPTKDQLGDFIYSPKEYDRDFSNQVKSFTFIRENRFKIEGEIKELIKEHLTKAIEDIDWVKCIIDIREIEKDHNFRNRFDYKNHKPEKFPLVIFTLSKGIMISKITHRNPIFHKSLDLLKFEYQNNLNNRLRIKLYQDDTISFNYHSELPFRISTHHKLSKEGLDKHVDKLLKSKSSSLRRLPKDEIEERISNMLNRKHKETPLKYSTISIILEEAGILAYEREISNIVFRLTREDEE